MEEATERSRSAGLNFNVVDSVTFIHSLIHSILMVAEHNRIWFPSEQWLSFYGVLTCIWDIVFLGYQIEAIRSEYHMHSDARPVVHASLLFTSNYLSIQEDVMEYIRVHAYMPFIFEGNLKFQVISNLDWKGISAFVDYTCSRWALSSCACIPKSN